jgi:sarcosine oxidase
MGQPRPPERSEAEFVIIGAGLLGLSTAWHLIRRGRDVLVLEAARVGHAGSGSRGLCRIFRLGYDDPRYVEMARQALPLWRELEANTGTALLTTTGQLTFGPGLDVLSAGLAAADADFELWSGAQAARHFPGVAPPGPAVFEPGSGVIHAERCLQALRRGVEASLHEDVTVVRLVDRGSRMSIETTAGTVQAAVAVCCAGPRTASLLATAGMRLPLSSSVEQVAYFPRGHDRLGVLPIIIERVEPMFYGLPTPDGTLFKVGRHHASPPVTMEAVDLTPDPRQDRLLAEATARLVPDCVPQPAASERCFYDNSPDENFVLDRVGRIVIGAGTSGHGFKFGPLLGEVLADLAEGNTPRLSIGWLGVSRPALAVS